MCSGGGGMGGGGGGAFPEEFICKQKYKQKLLYCNVKFSPMEKQLL
jgi:hypothetical protein